MAVMLAWLRPVPAANAVRDMGPCRRRAPSTRPRFCRRTLSLSLTLRAKQSTPHLECSTAFRSAYRNRLYFRLQNRMLTRLRLLCEFFFRAVKLMLRAPVERARWGYTTGTMWAGGLAHSGGQT